jgi:hypothetical protein
VLVELGVVEQRYQAVLEVLGDGATVTDVDDARPSGRSGLLGVPPMDQIDGSGSSYALGAAGDRGVDFLLDLFATDVRRTMALVGATSVKDLTPDLLA